MIKAISLTPTSQRSWQIQDEDKLDNSLRTISNGMKKYFIQYELITGQVYTEGHTGLFEFAKALDKAMENPNVNEHTITFWTKETA